MIAADKLFTKDVEEVVGINALLVALCTQLDEAEGMLSTNFVTRLVIELLDQILVDYLRNLLLRPHKLNEEQLVSSIIIKT